MEHTLDLSNALTFFLPYLFASIEKYEFILRYLSTEWDIIKASSEPPEEFWDLGPQENIWEF